MLSSFSISSVVARDVKLCKSRVDQQDAPVYSQSVPFVFIQVEY